MNREIKYISGKAKGYYKPLNVEQAGPYQLGRFKLEHVEVRNPKTIPEINFEELKVGNYHQPDRKVENVKIFINETDFFDQSCENLLLTNIELTDELSIEGEKLFRFTGDAFILLKKPLPPRTTNSPLQKSVKKSGVSSFLNRFFGSTSQYFSSGRNQSGLSYIKPDYSRVDLGSSEFSKTGKILSGIIGALIIAALLYLLIKFIFSSGEFGWIVGGLFFITVLRGIFKSDTNSSFTVIHPLRNLFGILFVIYAFYAMYNGTDPNAWIYLLLGPGLMLNARYKPSLRIIGFILIALSLYLFYRASQELIDSDDERVETVDDSDKVPAPEEDSESKYEGDDTVRIDYLKHRLEWKDNKRRNYFGTFRIEKDHFSISRSKREKLEVQAQNSKEYWNKVYRTISEDNKILLDKVIEEYKNIAKKNKLNRKQFADMIVTSVQNIPYYLVHDLSHKEAERQYGGFITEYHRSNKPCLEKMNFGLQSPAEFIGNLKGDCDTRSCFLYNVLNACGIPTIILASEQYGHAVIGVSGNYSGDFVKNKGIKYYAWETTNTGFVPGALSNECNNMRYWFVALGTNVK